MRFKQALVLTFLTSVCWPLTASANGRFPRAEQVLEDPRDPNHLYLAATFGLLETVDHGKHWYQICEVAFAGKQLEGDPLLEVLPNGSVLSGISETLNVSDDCGCAWKTVLGEPATEFVVDISRQGNTVVALVRDTSMFPPHLRVDESTDSGKTWHKLADLPANVADAFTIDVAPSDPLRLYASVAALPGSATAALLASSDRGKTWERYDIPGSSSNVLPFIAAVHPKDPNLLFVRTDNWDDQAEYGGQDVLLVSRDGGKNFSEALHRQAKILGFALAPDGETVLAGYGDPSEPGFTTNPDDFGIYQAKIEDLAFTKVVDEPIACLRWTASGIYACILQGKSITEAALGFSADADFTKTPALSPLLNLKQVLGPLACSGQACAQNWREGSDTAVAACTQLGADCMADPAMNTLTCPAGTGTSGGVSGGGASFGGSATGAAGGGAATAQGGQAGGAAGSSNGGAANGGAANGGSGNGGSPSASGGAGGGGATGGQTASGGAAASEPESGCGCRLIGGRAENSAASLGLGFAAFAFLFGRRSKRRKTT